MDRVITNSCPKSAAENGDLGSVDAAGVVSIRSILIRDRSFVFGPGMAPTQRIGQYGMVSLP